MFLRRPIIPAAIAGAAALSLYVATLAPGLIAIEDTPKFQFVGRILGTAHPPGYPFYVVVSHVFGMLPIGTLAWRINLLSALFAALSVVFYALAAIELGVVPGVAAIAGLGLATGSGFWFAATIAEVYSLHGCLVAAMTFALLRWRRTGRRGWFFAAIGLFSIGLGHHTSIVTTGPAVALFAIAVAPRFALAPRTIAAILGLFALGFSQYLFILIRTRQGGWGESPASNFSELVDVIRGARWASYVAPISTSTIADRAPGIVKMLASEVSWPIMVAAAVGMVVTARRDRPALALTLGSTAGTVAFSTFFSGQTAGFLQPAFFFVWLLAGVGIAATLRALPRGGWTATSIATLLLSAVVAWQVSRNFDARDLSHRRFEMRYLEALTNQLPPHSGLLAEDFLVDRMVLYEKFSGPTFTDRDLVAQVEAVPIRVKEYTARDYRLFAFETSAARLRQEGIDFDYAAWPLDYGSFRQYVSDQPAGTLIAVAVPALRLPTLLEQDALPLDLIGGRLPRQGWSNVAAIGIVGGSNALLSLADKEVTSVFAGRGLAVGQTGSESPADILAEAAYDGASIRIGARVIVRSQEPVVAVWSPRGDLVAAFALNGSGRVPMPDSALRVHQFRGVRDWTPLGTPDVSLAPLAAGGHLMIRQPSSLAQTVFYAGRRTRTLAPRLFSGPGGVAPLAVQELAADSVQLRDALKRDGVAAHDLISMAHVYRIELPAAAGTFHLGLGGIPDALMSRPQPAESSSAFDIDLSGQLQPVDAVTDRLRVARDHHQLFLAGGWSPIVADEAGGFSLITAGDAEILLPCGPDACSAVDLQLGADVDGATVGLVVNGTALPNQPLHAGWHVYRWEVPAASRHGGMNSFVVRPGSQARLSDVFVTRTPRPITNLAAAHPH